MKYLIHLPQMDQTVWDKLDQVGPITSFQSLIPLQEIQYGIVSHANRTTDTKKLILPNQTTQRSPRVKANPLIKQIQNGPILKPRRTGFYPLRSISSSISALSRFGIRSIFGQRQKSKMQRLKCNA